VALFLGSWLSGYTAIPRDFPHNGG
jgi:hypothetical protein